MTAVLIGPPGSGKSTVAHLLAGVLGAPVRESDDAVAADAGMPVPDIFVVEGEQRFRELEERACLNLLGDGGIVVLGGGAVASAGVRAALAGLPVVGLTVRAGPAISRLGMAGPHSVLMGPVHKQWSDLMNQRAPLYAEASRWTIDTSDLRPQQVADQIIQLLEAADE